MVCSCHSCNYRSWEGTHINHVISLSDQWARQLVASEWCDNSILGWWSIHGALPWWNTAIMMLSEMGWIIKCIRSDCHRVKVVLPCVELLVYWKAIEGTATLISRENPWILSIQSLEAHHRLPVVDMFCLSISLQMEGHGCVRGNIEHSIEFFHELWDELGSPVGYDYLGHSVFCVNVVPENSGPSFGGKFDIAGNRYDRLWESVDDHEDRVMSMQVRESSDHVDRYMHPWSFRDCVWVKRGCFSLHACLRSLASFAAFYIGFNVLFDLGPPEFAEYELLRLLNSWMASGHVVMTSGNDLASQRGFSWYVYPSVVVKESSFSWYPSIMREGGCDAYIPELFLLGCFFNLSVNGIGRGHDESSEVFGLKHYDIVIILLALIVVVVSGQKIGLLVENARSVLQHKVIFS